MRNENYPRRSRKQQALRRRSQQAERNTDAKQQRGRSLGGLQIWRREDDAPCLDISPVYLRDVQTSQSNYDRPMAVRDAALRPLVNGVFGNRLAAPLACIGNHFRTASATDDFRNSESRWCIHIQSCNGFKIQFQGSENPKRKITPAL